MRQVKRNMVVFGGIETGAHHFPGQKSYFFNFTIVLQLGMMAKLTMIVEKFKSGHLL